MRDIEKRLAEKRGENREQLGEKKIRSSWSWVKERKTGSSWEDSLKRKKSGEQNRGTGRERERSWERGVEKGFSAKGIFGIFQVRIREHI